MIGRSVNNTWGAVVAVMVVAICILSSSSAIRRATADSAQPATVITQGRPLLVTLGDWRFLNVTIQSFTQDTAMVLFGVFKNAEGQTVGIATGGITMSEGEVSDAYAAVCNVAPGTYTVFLFVISTPYDQPLSLSIMAQLTL